ncbi:MAG: tetratricopeptide repeat protein [Phycisphaerae bacterium]|nr:tetratricopeptide repeat protein [Phycisphaerae bacterium]
MKQLSLKDGNLHLVNAGNDLPEALIQVNQAISFGNIEQATKILNEQAIDAVHQILSKDPSRTDVMLVLAMLFKQIRQLQRAKEWFEKIIQQEPHALVYNELGFIYQLMGNYSKAIESYEKAVEINPDIGSCWANIAKLLIETGQKKEGVELFYKAVEKDPSNYRIHSNMLFYLHHLPDLKSEALFEEHKRWGQIHFPKTQKRASYKNNPNLNKKLKIGYISPDFCTHSVAYFFEPLLDGHDRNAVELYGYGSVRVPDATTQRISGKFNQYRNIFGVHDNEVARLIENDEIDILVDLAGHTTDNRLAVLAAKPAPIQVTYLGYLYTTGLEQVDYILTDKWADLPESKSLYMEKLFPLSHGLYCYKPFFSMPVSPLPAIRNGYITFGFLGNGFKLNAFILEIWSGILKLHKASHLLLRFGGGNDSKIRKDYLEYFGNSGIGTERIDIDGWTSHNEYIKQYSKVDIILDTYPKNGGTTTCEALWMGVPVISLVGQCQFSRTGLSTLSRAGLGFFAASTVQEYIAKAVALAGKVDSLEKIRSSLRERMTASGLCDSAAFAKSVEDAYKNMWHQWCIEKAH